MIRLPATLTDSTGGSVSATYTIDDTTSSVKDDLAVIANVVNQLLGAIRALERRIADLESK